jgi:hypothetical protein
VSELLAAVILGLLLVVILGAWATGFELPD